MKIRDVFKKVCVLSLTAITMTFSYLNCSVFAETNTTSKNAEDEKVVHYIDAEMSKMIDNKIGKGITVSIVKGDELVLCKGYGFADEKNSIPVDTEKSTFKIGSVSKTFVAVAAMQLVEQGKLDLKAPITEYLGGDFPKLKYPVTMEQLLTHTAGFDELISYLEVGTAKDIMPLGKFVKDYMPAQVFKPGEVSSYSNYGNTLAAYVIEKISGMSFEDYAEENIFKPLKMDYTTYKPYPKGMPAKGYGTDETEKVDTWYNTYPAGSVTSSAEDMAKYMSFLLNEKDQSVLSNASKQDMFSKHFSMDEAIPGIGYVWERHEINGHVFYTHGGTTANFISTLALFPEQNIGIFISINQNKIFELSEYVMGTAEMLYGKDKQKETQYTGKNLKDISGYYIPVRNVFKGRDKIFNYLMFVLAHYPKHITGNPVNGFVMDGEKLTPIGEDIYQGTQTGYIKFTQSGNNLYFSPKTYYSSFVRVPWYEGTAWPMFVVPFFILFGTLGFIVSIVLMVWGIVKKQDRRLLLACLPAIVVFLSFVAIVFRVINYIDYIDAFGGFGTPGLEHVVAFFRGAAVCITVSGILGTVSVVYFWVKKRHIVTRIFYSIWSLAVILFISWLIQMNLVI